jgi:L-cystine transport system ATP-binding protein
VPTTKKTNQEENPLLHVEGLHKNFGKQAVLKGLSLTVNEGQVVAVIGPSGSGKSTILRCLNLLERPQKGTITLGDRTVDLGKPSKQDTLYLRQNTAMVFQQFHLFHQKTALENVIEGLVTVKKVPLAQAKERGLALLDQVGLAHRSGAYPRQLSGGMQQRVGIARALAMEPQVLLLDEPTSALDPEMVGEVLNVIQAVVKKGQTTIIVSHEMGFVQEIADHVVFLDGGVVAAEGSSQKIFQNPTNERIKQFLARFNRSYSYDI